MKEGSKTQKAQSEKKAFQTPKLTIYGDIEKITKAASAPGANDANFNPGISV